MKSQKKNFLIALIMNVNILLISLIETKEKLTKFLFVKI